MILTECDGKAYGVGHASFTTSQDGKENWIVYHGMEDPFAGWNARTIRTQQFTWNSDGTPNFPRVSVVLSFLIFFCE